MPVAVIGCGYWGKNLVRNFEQLGALSLVCDMTETGRATAKELAPQARIVSDVNEVWASDVSGVVIATPAETHYALAKAALEAGKDVFAEKPLVLDIAEGDELVALAESKGRILMVGHVLEYHPGVLQLLEIIRSGELGDVQYIYSNRLSFGKVRSEENVLWSFAPHDIAVLLRLVGSFPTSVACSVGNALHPGRADMADYAVTTLQFPNGARGHILVSWLHPFKEQKVIVVGSKKMASFDDVNKKLLVYDKRAEEVNGRLELVGGADKGTEIPFGAEEPLKQECRAFLGAIESRVPPITDGKSGVEVLRVLQTAQESLLQNGIPVSL
jgi:predicted dehydrogenase